jgi:hypothetical protein
LKGVKMTPHEILEKSLEEDRFSSHTHELDLFAERAMGAEKGAYTIPERYDLDRCALLMVNPQRLFFYWEISRDTKNRFGIGDENVMQLCVMREETRVACAEVRGDVGSYYLSVYEPFLSLHAVLLWRGEDGSEHIVLRSKKVVSPYGRFTEGELWADKNGTQLLRASLPLGYGGSSGHMPSSIGLHTRKEIQ